MRLLIKNGCICNHDKEPIVRDIYMEDGIISEIGENLEKEFVDTVDAQGNFVIPGLVDMHCRVGEPGYEHQEDISSASKSAARGGFTSITCLPNTKPVIDNKTVVDYIKTRVCALSKVNIFLYGSMTKGCEGLSLAEIGEMVTSGVVAISDGGTSVSDPNLMRKILMYASMFHIPVITMCQDKSLAGLGVMNEGAMSTQIGLIGIPREAEEVIVARNILLSNHNKSKLHISHVSVGGAIKVIASSKKGGIDVTCGTCPHYFTLDEGSVASYNTLAKVSPPLRTKKDVERVKKGLVDGTIDVITSGHTPTTIESKQTEFDHASYGISSLETAFSVSYTALVKTNILTLGQLVYKMSKKPAMILGLDNKGEIAEGFDGDMVIFSDKKPFTIRADEFASKAKFSPYNGQQVYGEVLYTIVNGRVVYLK